MKRNEFVNTLADRHDAITDGVFAIAMTILALELAVPAVSEISSGIVLDQFIKSYLIPSILIYFLSFYLVYNFWTTSVVLSNFKKVNHTILMVNMFILASVCLIPFTTGFLFEFYYYSEVNMFFSILILAISLLYVLMFILLLRLNFKDYFIKKDEIKSTVEEEINSYDDGIELGNLKLYIRGVTLTLLYLLLSPVISSLVSLVLAFVSPILSLMSFLLILVLRFLIRIRRMSKDNLDDIKLSDEEEELVGSIRDSIYEL